MSKMNKYLYVFAAFIVVTVVIFVAFRSVTGESSSLAAQPSSSTESVLVKKDDSVISKKQQLLKDTSGDYYLGKDMAPVVIVEYASLSCPHCAKFHENVVEPLTPTYIDKGKVKFVFRDFPLNITAMAGAKMAHCAGADKYFSFLKVLFKSQEQWAFDEGYLTTLKNIAKLGGISEEQFDKCQTDKDLEEKILTRQKDAAEILEVQSTPTIFINGTKYEGNHSYEAVAKHIDGLLKGE